MAVECIFYTGKWFVQPGMRSSEKQLVGVADSASAEATKDIHCVQFAVNQS